MSARDPAIAAIHIAKAQLGLDDETYRALVQRFSGGATTSSRDMTPAARQALLDHFRDCGFKRPERSTAKAGGAKGKQLARLSALWISLWQLGVVQDRSEKALQAFVRRHTGIDSLAWNRAEDLSRAIDCLRSWAVRHGWSTRPHPDSGSYLHTLILAQWARLAALGAFRTGESARLETWLYHEVRQVGAVHFLDQADAQKAVDKLGKWLRRVAAASGAEGGEHG